MDWFEQQDVSDPDEVTHLSRSQQNTSYAAHRSRWGCSLFYYVDSNGDPNVPYDAAIFKNVADLLTKRGIKSLIVPEHHNTEYLAYTAPYGEFRLGEPGNIAESPFYLSHAFQRIYVADDDRHAATRSRICEAG